MHKYIWAFVILQTLIIVGMSAYLFHNEFQMEVIPNVLSSTGIFCILIVSAGFIDKFT